MGFLVAVVDKKGKNATKPALNMIKAVSHGPVKSVGIASHNEIDIRETVSALKDSSINSPIIIGYGFTPIFETDQPQPSELTDGSVVFDGRLFSKRPQELFSLGSKFAVRDTLKKQELDFAFVAAKQDTLIAARDPLGARPLYYDENDERVALASQCKALWAIRMRSASFPPGHFAFADRCGMKLQEFASLRPMRLANVTVGESAKTLRGLLFKSVHARIKDLDEVCLAFSGGLDSSLLAAIVKTSKVKIHAIHVSLEGQTETEHAIEAAKDLDIDLGVFKRQPRDVERTLPRVLQLIEEPDPVKTAIGIPLYWIADETKKIQVPEKVLITGQGADELFGGYKRYVDAYLIQGSEKAEREIINDVGNLYRSNLERDWKICCFHNVELRLPFVTRKMAEFAMSVPLHLKIECSHATLRKLILRRVATDIGLPRSISERPKKAVQYATGVMRELVKLARKRGQSVDQYLQEMFANNCGKAAVLDE